MSDILSDLVHNAGLNHYVRDNAVAIWEVDLSGYSEQNPETHSVPMMEFELFKYKKVADRTYPKSQVTPQRFQVKRHIPEGRDPLEGKPEVNVNPPENFTPGERFTDERREKMNLNSDGFLWDEEVRMAEEWIKDHESAFAWSEAEKGMFSEDYFPPIEIPTTEHEPWRVPNIPISRGIYERVIQIIKDKIAPGVYEPSNLSY
jgi:hypothetical protein